MDEYRTFTELLNGGDSGEHVQEFGTEPNNFQQTPIVNSTPVSTASQKRKVKISVWKRTGCLLQPG
jgi:hypothetical protein